MVKIGYLTKNEQSYKNKGELVVIDFPAGKELWKRKMNYMTDQFALLPEGVLFNSKGVKSSLLDLQTGGSKWNKKSYLIYWIVRTINCGLTKTGLRKNWNVMR